MRKAAYVVLLLSIINLHKLTRVFTLKLKKIIKKNAFHLKCTLYDLF